MSKPIQLVKIRVEGNVLYQFEDALYPEEPFTLELDYKDFETKEDYVTVARLLQQAARKKLP